MSKKVKVKTEQPDINPKDINELFEEMLGAKDSEIRIIRPKFVRIRNKMIRIYKTLVQFATFKVLLDNFPELEEPMKQILEFAAKMKESVFFDTEEEKEEKYTSFDKMKMNSVYRKLKENEYVRRMILLCSKLKQYKDCIGDKEALKDNFIGKEPGLSLIIFNFSLLDLKTLWAKKQLTKPAKQYILHVLHILWRETHELYQCVTSPDIDIDDFIEVIMKAINKLKTQPGLSRCTNAIRRLEKSVDLLKEKFSDYYRQSVASNNPNVILESFIVDVSNQGDADASLTREFRIIITHMHKVSVETGRNKDPQVQKLFGLLNKNFEMMEGKPVKLDEEIVTETDTEIQTAE
jgi:hypothetical protein